MAANTRTGSQCGFTLVELLIVLLLVALLASLVAPVVGRSIHQARESVLQENLYQMRKALDDFYADRGEYPQNLENLVEARYLRKIPQDPLVESDASWQLVRDDQGRVMDVQSGAQGQSAEGVSYANW